MRTCAQKVGIFYVFPYLCSSYTQYVQNTVHCTLYTVHCTLYTVHCTLYTVHCTLYTVQYVYPVVFKVPFDCTAENIVVVGDTATCNYGYVYVLITLRTLTRVYYRRILGFDRNQAGVSIIIQVIKLWISA